MSKKELYYDIPNVTSQMLALTSPTSGDRSVDTVRSRTQATKFGFSFFFLENVDVNCINKALSAVKWNHFSLRP
jgi:hypothetical protein